MSGQNEQNMNKKTYVVTTEVDTVMHKKCFIFSAFDMNINFKLKLSQSQWLKYGISCTTWRVASTTVPSHNEFMKNIPD